MRALLVIFASLLTACSAKYISPTSGDRAQLRIVAPDFGGWAGLRAVYYDNGSCYNPYVFAVISGLGTTESDTDTSIPETKFTENSKHVDRYITAGRVTMTFQSSAANYRCTVPLEVDLEKDKTYELLHYWTDDKCFVSITDLSEQEPKEVEFRKLDPGCTTGFNGVAL